MIVEAVAIVIVAYGGQSRPLHQSTLVREDTIGASAISDS